MDGVINVQSELWWLFARHMTIVLIVFYLIYSEVSTVVSPGIGARRSRFPPLPDRGDATRAARLSR